MEPPLSHEIIGALVEQAAAGRILRQEGVSREDVLHALRLHHELLSGRSDGAPFFGTALKRSAKSNVTLVAPGEQNQTRRWCVREFTRSPLLRFVPSFIRHRPALIAWNAAKQLKDRGITAVQALAVVLGQGRRSYLLMHAVLDAELLGDYVRRALQRGAASPARKRAFLRAGADFLATCYERGVFHADMKASNIFVRERDEGWEFLLLDLPAVQFRRHVVLKEKVLNLAQLNASLPLCITWQDRRRFLAYLAQHDAALDSRKVMEQIAAISRGRRRLWAA